jgi:ribonuclease R
LTGQDVLAHLARAQQPASLREIAHALDLSHKGRRVLPKLIAKLKRKGDIEEPRAGRYCIANQRRAPSKPKPPAHVAAPRKESNLIEGRIVTHRDGYGFVVPAVPVEGMEGDLFIGRDHLGDAMNGDRVQARVERHRRDGRAEGSIVRVLERAHATVVGLFRYGPRGNVVLPYDTRLLHEIVIPPGEELTPELRQKFSGAPGTARRVKLPELDGAGLAYPRTLWRL